MKKNIYIDYKIADTSKYLGNSFPPLIYKYLSKFENLSVFSLADKNIPDIDCIIIINGGSHWTYKDLKLNNIHKNQIIKWLYPKYKKIIFKIGYIISLNKMNFFKQHMYSNKSYEKHFRNLIKKYPNAKIIHRLDGIYQMIGKVYGYDKTIQRINEKSNLTIYQSKYSKTVWEKGVKTVFGNSTKIKPKDSVIINNGVDLSIFNSSGNSFNYGVKYPILNVSASPSPKKGLYKILELAECLKGNNEFHFYLIGNQVDDPLCGSDIKYFDNVSYLGKIMDRNKIASYYKGAKIFMFPSEEDCSPNVVIEAMACGLPILTTNSGGIPEIIECENKKAGIYIDELNPIMSLNTLIKFYEKFSKNASYLAKNYFDFEITSKNYLNEIKKIMS